MVERKINFSVDNIEVIDERNESQFATLKIDAFASGINRHETFVSEDTLRKTASTILEKPLVWIYDKIFQDAGSHDPLENPCGFVPADSPIEFRQLSDGRWMFSVIGKIWKRYSGKILDIFQRDDNEKPVSVEIEVYETIDNQEYSMTEIKDFCYSAITILGSFVTPAIPGAKADLIKFAVDEKKEYEQAYLQEFGRYDDINFKIPAKVKENARQGLELRKKYGRGGTSVGLASARYLINNDTITPEKVRHVAKYFPRHAGDNLDDKTSAGWIAWLLWGGHAARSWSQKIVDQMNKRDEQKMSYFNVNEEIDGKENINMEDEEKDKTPEQEVAMESPVPEKENEEETQEKMSAETDKETQETEEKEEYSLNAYLDVAAMLAMLENETENYQDIVAETQKGKDMNYGMVMNAMFQKMTKMQQYCDEMKKMADEKEQMSAKMSEMEKENEVYMKEMESLKEFKSNEEKRQVEFTVSSVLKEVEMAGMPKDKVEECREKSTNYSVDNINIWANEVKALGFSYVSNKKDKDNFVRIGLPHIVENNEKKSNSSWDELEKQFGSK